MCSNSNGFVSQTPVFCTLKFSINDSLIPINNLLGKKKNKNHKSSNLYGFAFKEKENDNFPHQVGEGSLTFGLIC